MTMQLRVLDMIEGTTVDGPGFRTSIYFAGCAHACPGCHNPQSWDFNGGKPISVEALFESVKETGLPVTFSGGDPVYQHEGLTELCRRIKTELRRDIWLYTGFTIEQLYQRKELAELLSLVDVIVDGPFIESLRDTSLLFRGSSNQRLIDMHRSTPDRIAEWQPEW